MKSILLNTAIVMLLVPAMTTAQLPPDTVPPSKPRLKRDRARRVLLPKVIQFEDERMVSEELVEMLSPPHGSIRHRAILALGRIGYPSRLPALIDVLNGDTSVQNRNPEVRALAAFSLGEIESHVAASYLLARLDPTVETSYLVRARAAEALGKIASNKLSAEALGAYGIRSISDALVRMLPPAGQQVSEEARFTGSLALTALIRVRQPNTVEAIAGQLRSTDPELRWQAANALARIRERIETAVPALLPLLADENWLVRAHAARSLGVAKAAQAVEPITKLLSDREERVVANAVTALGAIGDNRAAGPLAAMGYRLLTDYRTADRGKTGVPPQQNLLLLIATALGNIKDPRGLDFLKAFRLADGKLGSSPEVETAIAKFGEAAFFDAPESLKLPPGDWKAMAAYAQGLGLVATDRARALLVDFLSGKTYGKPDARAVPDILNALSAAKAEGLLDVLLAQLKAEDVVVRATAATLLGELGDSSDAVAKALEDAYKAARADKMNDARVAILEAADKIKRPMNVQALAEETRDTDYVVRLKAAELLRQSRIEETAVRVNIGKVDTGHDRNYWKRIAQLMEVVKNPEAVIHTKKGRIRIELYASDAPMTVDNFMQLARDGFYNGLTFMRVVPNFVIQGGDPRDDMNGGPGYQIRDEINLRRYETGTVGMALSGKDTGGSQFFITHSPQPHLDGGYTVFGKVVEGMEIVNRIARGDRIERVEIVEGK
jgi:cyclophilin family peptidyl-prolyl cis-trans isomerase